MVTAADNGLIDLYDDCGWRVGQERTVNISAIANTGTYDRISWAVSETQPAQTITLVLMHRGLYQLVTPVKAKGGATRNTCSFIVGMKDCLLTKGSIDTSARPDWNNARRRDWCNSGFRQSFPETIRNCFKQFKCTTGKAESGTSTTGGTNIITQDYFSIAAVKEIEGSSMSRSTNNEANALTQFTWYTTQSNKIKKINDVANTYWTRSPYYHTSYSRYCQATTTGAGIETVSATGSVGISPFGVI